MARVVHLTPSAVAGAVALLSPTYITVVDAESLQLRYDLQLDWLTHVLGISAVHEKMRTTDWFDPTKMGKKAVKTAIKGTGKLLEIAGVTSENEIRPPISCALEVGSRLWFGYDTGHICAIQSTTAVLETAILPGTGQALESLDAPSSLPEAAITSLAAIYHKLHNHLVLWAGKSDGSITVLEFTNAADVSTAPPLLSIRRVHVAGQYYY